MSKSLNLFELVKVKKIVFLDYVSDEQLSDLYRNAFFLLYTSKSEGFGLPALEAAKRFCPVVAAYGTSIPEVLDSAALYVNPYSIDSIASGIERMCNENIRKQYCDRIKKIIPLIEHKIDNSNKWLFDFIFN